MNDDHELKRWIEGCLKGDKRSQQAIHRAYYGKMKSVCMRYTRDADHAQDILQEGFIKIFSNIDRYTGSGSFEGWMRRIMVNLAIDYFRKSKHDFLLLGDDHMMEDFGEEFIDEEEDELDYEFKPSQIIEAMQQLSPAYRTIFNLYVFENMTHKDIAEKIGISVGTSKSNFSKAKRNLKKILLKDFRKANEQDVNAF